MPPWLDELAAIVCVVGGIISILALLEVATDNAAWPAPGAAALRALFGDGSLLLALAMTLLGLHLLLPLERRAPFSPRRILGAELAFLALLALFHLRGGQPELATILYRGQAARPYSAGGLGALFAAGGAAGGGAYFSGHCCCSAWHIGGGPGAAAARRSNCARLAKGWKARPAA